MNSYRKLLVLLTIAIPYFALTQPKLKLENQRIVPGETLRYKACWGPLTIGSAVTKVDKTIYKVGGKPCYNIEIMGQTNGLAKLFYVRDRWQSYIDTANITTHKAFRSIREGNYELDEVVHFDHQNKKAEVKVLDKKTKAYVLKKNYDTPENIRDVVAGFMVLRLIDLERYKKNDIITVNGFYEDEGYKIDVEYVGKELVDTERGTMLCYRVRPVVPKNKVFNGKHAIDVWFSADRAHSIVRIRAKLFLGNLVINLEK